MASPIDILINATWRGGRATGEAERELRNLGNTVSTSAVELAAVQARSRLLQSEMGRLAEQVARGNISVDDARGKYNQFAGSLATIDNQAQRTGINIGAMAGKIGAVTIALGAATLAGRKFFQALEAGAGLELTAQRFDNLAQSIGTTGDVLRDDLQAATSGMLSTAQSMALATDLVGLNLATTSEEAVRMARVVTELDQDLNQLTQALANQSTRRLDQLGVSVVVFREKLEGMSDDMTDEEAYRMAFLEAAEHQIERVGGAADTTAGDIRRLQADWAALNEEIDIFLAKRFGPVLAAASGRTAEGFREAARAAAEAAEDVQDLEQANEGLSASFKDLALSAPNAAGLVALSVSDARAELARELALMTGSAEEFEEEFIRIFGSTEAVIILNRAMVETSEEFFNMARAANEAASADQVLIQSHQQLNQETEQLITSTEEFLELLQDDHDIEIWEQRLERVSRFGQELEELNRIAREGLPDPVGEQASREAASRQLDIDNQLLQDRADLFEGFQESMTAVTEREEERRLQLTEQHESRRTDLIADFNRQREQEEADFQRERRRQEEDLARDIADVQEDAAERQAQLRDDANRRIADLEEDHLQRMADITADADLQLQDAASRLDATAVHRITQQRDQALEAEEESFEDQRQQIQEDLDRRLQLEQEAAEERIQELNEFHDRRQAQEDEDRAIRLQREQEAHDRQLAELDANHQARLTQLQTATQNELSELEQKYEDEHELLTASGAERLALQQAQQAEILAAEEAWWNDRLGLITGGSGGGQGPGGTTGASGGGQGFPGSAPFTGTLAGGNLILNEGAIQVYGAPGQSAEDIGQEVSNQLIDRYMINLMAGGP